MTSTHWLLLGLIVFFALCLFAFVIGCCINAEWRNADEPVYRTADGETIAKQIKSLRRKRS